ncbi:hypothetical protein cgR_5022 [Corynebacterium glutamicum R]|uniref:Uncharacterized protein n=1 Tax=Corynebacterium glutamicum (strain R) TaxID=340322 RepID=A0AB72VAQ4_CORGB|nr:hypothetical protein cgR_5022 [Corynebacterium glutamicum R]
MVLNPFSIQEATLKTAESNILRFLSSTFKCDLLSGGNFPRRIVCFSFSFSGY